MLFRSFPHSDATWPESPRLLAEHAAHLDESTRRRILHDNAAELYRVQP